LNGERFDENTKRGSAWPTLPKRAVELSFRNSTILSANRAAVVPMGGLAISAREWLATLSVDMAVLIEPVGLLVREQSGA